MQRYACTIKMAIKDFGFSVTCWFDAKDMPEALFLLNAKMLNAQHARPELVFREVSVVGPTIVGKGSDADNNRPKGTDSCSV